MTKKKDRPSEAPYAEIKVRVIPRSSKNEIIDVGGDAYKVRTTAPPVDGLANKALKELLAKRIGLAKSRLEISTGLTSRTKTVRVHGLSAEDVRRRLGR